MTIGTVFNLIGMSVGTLAGLVLATSAVGVERVKALAGGTSLIWRIISRDPTLTLVRGQRIAAVLFLLVTYGVAATVLSMFGPLLHIAGFEGAAAFVSGLIYAIALFVAVRLLLFAVSAGLLRASILANRKLEGVVGATLLVIGFILQFVGTFYDAVHTLR